MNEDCVDKNTNNAIETSQNPGDILAWGGDECVIWNTILPSGQGQIVGPRGVIWTLGTWNNVSCQFEDP
ncbi:MAG: hypothetical protein H6713_24970 [Myxococcales bacterium]|nr:hypothetical protein [Myxococcales bacterium]MCB9753221.1 hypothetical protein [Myxococcales bacterium]